jgi:hypothetical protein
VGDQAVSSTADLSSVNSSRPDPSLADVMTWDEVEDVLVRDGWCEVDP